VLALGLASTAGVTYAIHDSVRERDHGRFENAVQSTHDRIQNRLDTHTAVLVVTRGLFTVQQQVSQSEFRDFVEQLELRRRYPGIQGIGFSRRIAPEQVDSVEEEMRGHGDEGYRVWPRHLRDEYHAVVFLEPRDGANEAALGYDMFTEPTRREAMQLARDSGLPAASGRVTLIREFDGQNQDGLVIYVPVYRKGVVPETVEERREALIGFVYSPLRMGDLMSGIFGSELEPRVSFTVHDGPLPLASELMHDSAPEQAKRKPRFTTSELLPIAGRTWLLTFHSQPAFESGSGQRMVPYIGLLGILLSSFLYLLSRGQARAHEKLGEHARVLEILTSERSELLAREQEVRAEAEAASRAKDEFLAMLGHELRNPLAPIVTGIELIKLRRGGQLDREHQVIERQVNHVVRLVDDLLDVSRITRGKIALRRQPVSISALVAKAVEMASPVLEENRHHLTLRVPPRGLWVDGDETRLSQVIANLLSNAAKYTEPGGHIEVEARREDGDILLRVADDGIGIASEMLPRVFDLFTQGQRGIDRSQGGLGLGLTLVRRLVEAHGGEVTAASEGVGRGSVFTVILPGLTHAGDEAGAPDRALKEAGGSRRVMVVDDNKDAAELLAELLRGAGHAVVVAHDGPSALEIAERFQPEIAVLDIGLPVMDGYELGARLRRSGRIRLVAVTGYGQEHDHARSREAEFELHLVKPIDPAALLAALDERPPAKEPRAPSAAPSAN
jgi:signal transduction histidine kinase/ActR/RegA family two-component response regulator